MYKVCNTCKLELPLSDFHKHKSEKDGHQRRCKKCRKSLEQETTKSYYQKNANKLREYSKEYYEEHKSDANLIASNRIRCKKWQIDNADLVREKKKFFYKEPSNRLKVGLRARLSSYNINLSLDSILSDVIANYVKHIEDLFEDWMSWDNQGTTKGSWQIDHIIPVSRYTFFNEDGSIRTNEVSKCFNKLNTRPISVTENKAKLDKLDMELIKHYKIEHLLPSNL